MIITFNDFIQKYNEVYNMNTRYLSTNTHDICSIMNKLYDTDYFEINEDNETIELF